MKRQLVFFCAAIVTATVMLFLVPFASAQSLMAMGEARITGKAFIKSFDGQWMAAPTSYPVLEGTSIRTAEGSVVIYLEDGSRISLSRMTGMTISGSTGNYRLTLSKGKLIFNIVPSATFFVKTPAADIFPRNSAVANGKLAGVIFICDKGTELKNNAGTLVMEINGVESKVVDAGQSRFAGADGRFYASGRCGKLAGVVLSSASSWPAYSALVAYVGGEAYAVEEGFGGATGFASPSSPASCRIK